MKSTLISVALVIALLATPAVGQPKANPLWPEFERLCLQNGGSLESVGEAALANGYQRSSLILAAKRPGDPPPKPKPAPIPADRPLTSGPVVTFMKPIPDGRIVVFAFLGDYPADLGFKSLRCSLSGPRLTKEDNAALKRWLGDRPAQKAGEEATYLLSAPQSGTPLNAEDSQATLLARNGGYVVVTVRRTKRLSSIDIWTYKRTP